MDIVANAVQFIVSIGFMIGVVMIGVGIFTLKRTADNPSQYPLGNAMATIGAGTLLLVSESLYQILYVTGFGSTEGMSSVSPLAPGPLVVDAMASGTGFGAGVAQYIPDATASAVTGGIYVIGVIAYIRGVYKLRHAGVERPGVDHPVSSAFLHIFGGFLLINMNTAGCWIAELLGFGMVCP